VTDLSRRGVVFGASTLGVAVPLLAACGSSSNTTATAPTTAAATGSAGSAGSTGAVQGVIATKDVPEGSGVILASANLVVTQPTAGTYKLFNATCTHAGCQVGSISGTTIQCPCHGSEFSTVDGSVIQGPASTPLKSVDFEVLKGEIVPEVG